MRLLVDLSSIPRVDNWDTGLVRYAVSILYGFKDLGIKDVTLLVPAGKAERFRKEFPDFGLLEFKRFKRIPVLSKPFPRFLLDSLRWKRTINNSGHDLLFRPFFGKQFDFWKLNIPFVLTVHDLQIYRTTSFYNSFITKKFLFPRIVRQAKGIITISDFVKRDLLSFFKDVPESKVTVIHNAVVIPEKTESLPDAGEGPFILTVNSLVPYKNVITLLKAFNSIRDIIPHKLIIVGKESRHWNKVLWKYIKDNRLEEQVILTGHVSDGQLFSLYRNADLFVTTSLMEGFGYSPAEAAIAGTKVISTRETALPETTMERVNYYEPATDAGVLAEKILEVLKKDDKEERERISLIFKEEYDPVTKAREVYDYLEKACL